MTPGPVWRAWAPEGCLAAVVLVLGLLEATSTVYGGGVALGLVVLGAAVSTLFCRHAPGAALALVWLSGVLQLVTGTQVLLVQAAVAVVAFGCARWGDPMTVVISGLSIPAAAGIGVLLVYRGEQGYLRGITITRSILDGAHAFSDTLLVGAVILGMLVLALPWLAGLVVRATQRARRSQVQQVAAEEDAARAQREAGQAQEIARLRGEQARLARDVHDVVGHSLAVILAQAESAQYLPGDDPERLKQTMATIATSARSSLQDVRQVLTTTQAPVVQHGGLDRLLEGVRASGHDVLSTQVGHPQPLPPELDVVAYRVLQEMLTNAIKHGRRDTPVQVERHWEGELRLEVRNVVAGGDLTQPLRAVDVAQGPLAAQDPGPGQGVEGMRRRLEAVGGRLDVRRREEPTGPTFTATAWVPLRGLP
jgi:signal transduction histidine kinase